MTINEVAELARTSPSSVRFWVHSGTGPRSVRLGRRRLFAVADVEKWLDEQYGRETKP